MRGSRPCFWKRYEASQLGIAAACMTHTKRSATVPVVAVTTQPVVPRPATPKTAVFVVGPMIGGLNGHQIVHSIGAEK
jgi:hypothetical protein